MVRKAKRKYLWGGMNVYRALFVLFFVVVGLTAFFMTNMKDSFSNFM